jgi:hypothetical protein
LVLVILAVIWAAVLLPPFLQNRSESRPADSISTFRNQLNVLERRSTGTGPVSTGTPRSVRPMGTSGAMASPYSGAGVVSYRPGVDRARLARMAAKKRRRDILVTLLAAAGLTFLLGLVLPSVLMLHVLIDVVLAGYVALLVQRRKLAEERSMKVRYMSDAQARRAASRRPQAAPELALRRTASN